MTFVGECEISDCRGGPRVLPHMYCINNTGGHKIRPYGMVNLIFSVELEIPRIYLINKEQACFACLFFPLILNSSLLIKYTLIINKQFRDGIYASCTHGYYGIAFFCHGSDQFCSFLKTFSIMCIF